MRLVRFIVALAALVWSPPFSAQAPVRRPCPQSRNGVNILLVDNSKSVPNIDPRKNRVEVLEEILDSQEGAENRLVLFGGRDEIATDSPARFVNDGMKTDYYYAFREAVRVRSEYPPDCAARMILITDGILDAFPSDYQEMKFRDRGQAKAFSREQTLLLLDSNRIPLYIIVLGDRGDEPYIQDLSIHANGFLRANPLVESAVAYMGNEGFFFKQFVFRHDSAKGVKGVVAILRQITQEESSWLEMSVIAGAVGLLALAVVLILRRFPGPGDREIILLPNGATVLVGADIDDPKGVVTPEGVRPKAGLQLAAGTAYAVASVSLLNRGIDFGSGGLTGVQKLSPASRRLLDEDVSKLSSKLDQMEKSGTDEEIILATDLRYYCSNLEPERVRQVLATRDADRMALDCKEFLQAKVYASLAPDLLRELTEYRVFVSIPGRNVIRMELVSGMTLVLGRYTVRVESSVLDSQFGATVTLEYVHCPSMFALKRVVPRRVQRALRLRKPMKCSLNA